MQGVLSFVEFEILVLLVVSLRTAVEKALIGHKSRNTQLHHQVEHSAATIIAHFHMLSLKALSINLYFY